MNALQQFLQSASNEAAGAVSAPVDLIGWALRKAGVPVPQNALMSSDWMRGKGLLVDVPQTGASLAGQTFGLLLPGAGVAHRLLGAGKTAHRVGVDGKMGGLLGVGYASKSPKIYDPPPTAKRSFNDDYPQGVAGSDGGRLAFDIEGRPIVARYVAGRRVGGGVDEAIPRGDSLRIADLLGVRWGAVPRSGPELKGDAGRYIGGPDRRMFVDQSLPGDQAARVFEHELGHSIDDLVFGVIGPGGSRIPTKGLSKELARVYEDLNTGGWFKPGRGMTPKGQGYAANQTDAELIAEAVRAYMRDPNYLKTVAPKTAARIREHVNANQNLSKAIQFNSPLAGLGLLGLISDDDGQ